PAPTVTGMLAPRPTTSARTTMLAAPHTITRARGALPSRVAGCRITVRERSIATHTCVSAHEPPDSSVPADHASTRRPGAVARAIARSAPMVAAEAIQGGISFKKLSMGDWENTPANMQTPPTDERQGCVGSVRAEKM